MAEVYGLFKVCLEQSYYCPGPRFIKFEFLKIFRNVETARNYAAADTQKNILLYPEINPAHPEMTAANNYTYVGKRKHIRRPNEDCTSYAGYVIEKLKLN